MEKYTKAQVAVLIESAYLKGMYDWDTSTEGERGQLINNWADGTIADEVFKQYGHK